MKKMLGCLLLVSGMAFASGPSLEEKVIYGEDDRRDVFESPNALYKQLANSTAAMISTFSLEEQGNDYIINGSTLEQDGICPDAKFSKQVTAANCSGFLVSDQLLVTAGHCIEDMSDCERYSWVFGFSNNDKEQSSHKVSKGEVYKCTSIVARKLDDENDDDYALVKLDRKVKGHTPLKVRTSGKIANGASILVIGHPSGLPTKISDGAIVRSNSNKVFFQTTLDTFGGNSGSAVFDAKTGTVEGILVRGERDYVQDPVMNCARPKVCKVTECRGEDVTRITNIKRLACNNRYSRHHRSPRCR